jgi:hypothetical protein
MTSHGDHALDVIVAERACERLLYEYARCIDGGDAADVAELFTDDAVWLADDIDMRGREAIRKAFNGRQSVTRRQSRHVRPFADGAWRIATLRFDVAFLRSRPG